MPPSLNFSGWEAGSRAGIAKGLERAEITQIAFLTPAQGAAPSLALLHFLFGGNLLESSARLGQAQPALSFPALFSCLGEFEEREVGWRRGAEAEVIVLDSPTASRAP